MPPPDTVKFDMEMTLGDQSHREFMGRVPDTNQAYWFIRYIWELNQEPWIADGRYYLCDFSSGAVIATRTASVERLSSAPRSFELFQNYPNPFNPTTTIEFILAEDAITTLKVYDMLGREVATLVNEKLHSGFKYKVEFNAANLASGLYIYRLEAGRNSIVKKLVLVK
jgi:hypothetical protein